MGDLRETTHRTGRAEATRYSAWMPVYAQCLDLVDDPDLIREYVDAHRNVPKAVEQALRAIGIERMRIHRLGSRLYMTIETREGFDPARDYQRYAQMPGAAAWDARMRKYQKPSPGARPGEWWAAMEPVYVLTADVGG
ncbi:MAG: L-rhamnose mutarotase [Phycisphaerae bacterium]|nr:L-rhamnose mutarotase [Phycisphaerae bacterium]